MTAVRRVAAPVCRCCLVNVVCLNPFLCNVLNHTFASFPVRMGDRPNPEEEDHLGWGVNLCKSFNKCLVHSHKAGRVCFNVAPVVGSKVNHNASGSASCFPISGGKLS